MHRKEVMNVSAELLTNNERQAVSPVAATPATPDDELRAWARKHVRRIHRLKRDVAVYVLGMLVLTSIWALVQWQDNGAFERFSSGGNSGDWDPWIFYVALIWGFFVALDVVKVYFDRPTTEAEIERAMRRLKPRD